MLKITPEAGIKFVESATNFAESGRVCGSHERIIIHPFSRLKRSWSPQSYVESEKCRRYPQNIAESTNICGIRLHLQNPEQLPIFAR